ncbi:MAG: STAS domain-containing protein [Candidatus Omnitrophica bacterium]|nr:STAS domain-containing protein [Candidatus Omnitrophota bacterium]
MDLTIQTLKKGDSVFTLALNGEINSQTHQLLEDELKKLINDQTKAVFLDMSRISYISSIGVKTVLSAKKVLKEKNANFAMVNLQPGVKKVFDVLKLLPIFEIFDEMPEADKYIDQIIKEEMNKQAA